MEPSPGAGDVLFFIPDIGGFTKFVSQTEISHSQHIVQELLELLVDANSLSLQVAEFEGDAVLFYRMGRAPTLAQLALQARQMFIAFHSHLRRFEYHRVCHCGACSTAVGLELKIVAHSGSAAVMTVKNQKKFIGTDIIIAHRLLKNTVTKPQYLLVTDNTTRGEAGGDPTLQAFWPGRDRYDEIGDVSYRYQSLEPFLAEVRVDPAPHFELKNPRKRFTITRVIDAPMQLVYQKLIDLPARMNWMDGITAVEQSDPSPNRIGKVHRCVRGTQGTAVITSATKATENAMELWETDVQRNGACRYHLTRTPAGATNLAVEVYTGVNRFRGLVFQLLMARKLQASFERSINRFAALFANTAA